MKKNLLNINDNTEWKWFYIHIIGVTAKLQIKINVLQYLGLTASLNTFKSAIPNINIRKLTYPIRPSVKNIFIITPIGCGDFYNIQNKNNDVPTSK